uniref:Chemosensory protein 1 n=1 Tax=Glossina morsitans morsitans TaxID=37546 RepID=D2EBA7_GLOMM|nr:hypothetical protein [Glossina morsitans]CBA11327.1 chemosensory protein 1 [Glossina morsitans morsitans]
MKYLTIVAVIATLSAVVVMGAEEKYTTKYDDVDVDEVLKSDRLFKNYYNCLIDQGKCTPDARELKKSLPDALQTECSKCSEKQKKTSEKVIKHLMDHKPEEWKVLQTKYDPEGIYYSKYKARDAKA